MQHLDEGTLHALVDGEVDSEELGAIQAHLETCADCRVRLDEARAMAGEAEQLVEAIEVPGPGRQDGTTAGRQRPKRWPVRELAWAASIVVAAGLGYAGGREPQIIPEPQLSAPTGPAQAEADAPAGPPASVSERFRAERDTGAGADQERRGAAAADQIANRRLDDSPARDLDRSPAARVQEGRVDTSQMAKTLAVEPTREPASAAPAAPPPVPSRAPAEAAEVTDALRSRLTAARRLEQGQRAAQVGLARVNEAAFVTVTLEEANRLLGGRLRRLDGLVPERVQARGLTVQVIYPLADGVLILEQFPEGDSVAVQLSGPPSIGPDSLDRLYSRIR